MTDLLQRIVEALGGKPTGQPNSWLCHCPAHDDRNPSLSVTLKGGKILFYCHAGCSQQEVLDALKARGLLLEKSYSGSRKKKGKLVETYNYVDEAGKFLFQVCRYANPKGFSQRRLRKPGEKSNGKWVDNIEGVRRVLYRLPELAKADEVVIVEGEKDVNNLAKLGFIATTSPMGARNWLDEYAESLRAKDVVLIPDCDAPGHNHAQKIAKSLEGIAKSVKIITLPGLAEHGDVTDWLDAGHTKAELLELISQAEPVNFEDFALEAEEGPETAFELAKERYPKTDYPWETLPESIANSLRQLARACATSPTSLPGAAISIFASAIGSTVDVSPKKSWREPLIFWCGDIRPSGEGKTPPPRALMHVLYEAQQMANDAYKLELEAWELLPRKDRGKPPDKPRGYYVTDLTLEGLRTDHSGHGGKVCVLDELSSFLTSQNQYKKKGSDRESWLCLHDGNPARIVRAKETLTLTGCRISVFGGIQPGVWQKIFSEDDGLHLVDGTIFRFLPTYEGASYHPLTKESWSDDNRKIWESLLRNALSWADSQEKPRKLLLSEDAQEIFFEWRNDLFQTKDDLPPQIRGFVPKLVGYALRFAGVFYLMHRFSQGREIGDIIHRDYIEKGIRVSEFYLGHIICAMEALAGDVSSPLEFTEQIIHLAKTLESLKPELDSGRLAVGYLHEKFNATCKPEQKISSPKAMGALLRHCKLTIPRGTFNANGKRGVFCLQWDEKTNIFIKTSPPSPPSPLIPQPCGLQPADIEKVKSAKSADAEIPEDNQRTWRTLEKQSPQPETGSITNKADMADMADIVSEKKEKKNQRAPEPDVRTQMRIPSTL